MKILISWNCWSNYDDVLLNSEICKNLNKDNIFENLYMTAQSAYTEDPNSIQIQYLDNFFKIKTNLDDKKINNVNKQLVPARIFQGFKIAYEYALSKKCDYAIVTNADAWFLNFKKLKKLLSRREVSQACLSSRVGKLTFLFSNFGSYAPFYDDHFLVINVKECKKYDVFNLESLDILDTLYEEGSFDYQFSRFLDFNIPNDKHYVYSDLSKSTNHFGLPNNVSLLPFIYEHEYGFLHSNVAVDNYLHYHRAKLIENLKLNSTYYVSEYCKKYQSDDKFYYKKNDFTYLKPHWSYILKVYLFLFLRRIYYSCLIFFKYKKINYIYQKYINKNIDPLKFYHKYINIPSTIFSKVKYHHETKLKK